MQGTRQRKKLIPSVIRFMVDGILLLMLVILFAFIFGIIFTLIANIVFPHEKAEAIYERANNIYFGVGV